MRINWLVYALAIACTGSVLAADNYPLPIQRLVTERHVEIIKQFAAPGGMTGYAAKVNGHSLILYLTADKKYVIAGTMLDAEGQNVTQNQVQQYIVSPQLATAWAKLEKAAWVPEGSRHPTRIVYEFTDPNCPFCHLFWLASQPYYKHGLQIRHLLVGVITKSSRNRAAAILEAADPSAAISKNERDYNTNVPEDEAGGVAPAKAPKAATLAKIKANEALMDELGIDGTPGLLYKDAAGNVHSFAGLPHLSMLSKIFRLPAQPITNPLLKKYE